MSKPKDPIQTVNNMAVFIKDHTESLANKLEALGFYEQAEEWEQLVDQVNQARQGLAEATSLVSND